MYYYKYEKQCLIKVIIKIAYMFVLVGKRMNFVFIKKIITTLIFPSRMCLTKIHHELI